MSELEQLRQEAEQLRNQIRVSPQDQLIHLHFFYFFFFFLFQPVVFYRTPGKHVETPPWHRWLTLNAQLIKIQTKKLPTYGTCVWMFESSPRPIRSRQVWTPWAGSRWGQDARSVVTWPRSTPCTGARTPGECSPSVGQRSPTWKGSIKDTSC